MVDAVLRLLRYLKGTPGKGLLYVKDGHTRMEALSDADWAGSPDDRKSTTGYCVFLGENLLSWKSKKEDVVARSSAESRALGHLTAEVTYYTCNSYWVWIWYFHSGRFMVWQTSQLYI